MRISQSPKSNKNKKRMGCLVVFIIILTIALTLIGLLVLNVNGIRDNSIHIFKNIFLPAEEHSNPLDDALRIKEIHLEKEKTRLLAWEEDLRKLRTTLDATSAQIMLREDELTASETEIHNLKGLLSKAFDELSSLITIYEKMESDYAAKILSEFTDIDNVTVILKNMKVDKCAEILSSMDAKKAAQILSNMMD